MGAQQTTGHQGSTHSSTSAPPGSRREHRTELQRLQDQMRLWREGHPRDMMIEGLKSTIIQEAIGLALLDILEDADNYGIDTEALIGRGWAAFTERREDYRRQAPALTTEPPRSSASPSPRPARSSPATSGPDEDADDCQ